MGPCHLHTIIVGSIDQEQYYSPKPVKDSFYSKLPLDNIKSTLNDQNIRV